MRWNLARNFPFFFGKKSRMLCSIDHANNQSVSGWCFDFNHPDTPVKLHFFMDDWKIGDTCAAIYREDVKSYNLHPSGFCGFDFFMPRDISIKEYEFLDIFVNGFKKPLRRIPTGQLPIVMEGPLPKIFFMHIPKTAGTSFNAFCRLHFPADKILTHIESIKTTAYPALVKEKNYIAGHLTLNKIKEELDVSGFDLLTLVREPFRHLHSHLKWVRNIASDPTSGFFLKHHPVIRELALKLSRTDLNDKNDLQAMVDNLGGIEVDLFDNLLTRYFLSFRPERVSSAHFEHAKKNLDRFKIIGTTENYAQFIDRVCKAYRIENTNPSIFNRSSGNKLFPLDDPDIRSILNPLVESDLMLYKSIAGSPQIKKVVS